jgi:Vacuolar protein 14 C-terminal Fig4p binding
VEPERYPYLYKCLYGLLMLLPQSSAFAALKNRLNSVSAIAYLQIAPRPYVSLLASKLHSHDSTASPSHSHSFSPTQSAYLPSMLVPTSHNLPPRSHSYSTATHVNHSIHSGNSTTAQSSSYDRPNRLTKGREADGIKWQDLLEKFKAVQDRARRFHRAATLGIPQDAQTPLGGWGGMLNAKNVASLGEAQREHQGGIVSEPHQIGLNKGMISSGIGSASAPALQGQPQKERSRSGLGNLGRLTGAGRKKDKERKA